MEIEKVQDAGSTVKNNFVSLTDLVVKGKDGVAVDKITLKADSTREQCISLFCGRRYGPCSDFRATIFESSLFIIQGNSQVQRTFA